MIDVNVVAAGVQGFALIKGGPFTASPGELRYPVVAGDVDGDGDGTADRQIEITGKPLLGASDFML